MTKEERHLQKNRTGLSLLIFSVITRGTVLLLLCLLAMWTEYLNLKTGYNHPRLVELSSGKTMRIFYECSDAFFSLFGDPLEVAQRNGGMTWSIRLMGMPFTDPIAAISVAAKDHQWTMGFALGLIFPVGIALVFGRLFCSYICPASLLFFTIARVRRLLAKFFYFPEISVNRGLAWGVLLGGTVLACLYGHGVWTLILPYFAIGQTIFHGLAFGSLSIAVISITFFVVIDFVLGNQFTCRYICPTGRLLGFLGKKAVVSVRRDADHCLSGCNSCHSVCPFTVNPKADESYDCSLCGECLTICPTQCLTIGLKK